MSEFHEELLIELCRENAVLPKYANDGDAGMDLYSCAEVVLKPGETKLIPVGLKMAIPYGYEVQVRPRSGISLKTPLRIPNAPGTIDCGYRDEVNVIMHNSSTHDESTDGSTFSLNDKGNKNGTYVIHEGDRVAQMVFTRVSYADLKVVESVQDIGSNRGGGFGHSGIN